MAGEKNGRMGKERKEERKKGRMERRMEAVKWGRKGSEKMFYYRVSHGNEICLF